MAKRTNFLGSYRLTRLIRVGSTCQVWEAVDQNTQKKFAIKLLREELRGNKAEVNGLKFEFDVAKEVTNSPRIITIHEFINDSSGAYLVLELFSELNMKQALRYGPESLAYMLNPIIEQAAEGLYHMHGKGWIHCDVKPDNFLVSEEGVVKLIDFTISQKKKTGLGKLFGSKLVQGTRSYMAPEQIRRKALDERADVYSFGCVLFELATGKPPYTGNTPNDLLSKHLNAPIPSPLTSNDNISQEFADVIKKMLAKSKENRFEDMWDFLKTFRGMRLFKKTPRQPDISVFDVASGMKTADDLIKMDDPERRERAEREAEEKKKEEEAQKRKDALLRIKDEKKDS